MGTRVLVRFVDMVVVVVGLITAGGVLIQSLLLDGGRSKIAREHNENYFCKKWSKKSVATPK